MKPYKVAMLAISLAVLMGVVYFSNPFVIADKFANSSYEYIAAAFALSLFALMLGTLKWHTLLKKLKLRELFPVQMLGYTISNFTPAKAGEPAKAVLLKMRSNIPVSHSLPSIIWERVLDVIVLLVFSMVAVSTVSVSSNFFLPSVVSIMIFASVVVVSLSVLYSEKFGRRLFSLLRKLPVLRRLQGDFMDLFYKSQIEKTRIAKSFVLTFVTWFTIGCVLYLSLMAFGVAQNPLVLTGIVALSVVIGIASSLPGGIGTTEIVMIFLLGVVGVDAGVAAAATITFRLATIWMTNILGGVSFVYLSRKFNVKNLLK